MHVTGTTKILGVGGISKLNESGTKNCQMGMSSYSVLSLLQIIYPSHKHGISVLHVLVIIWCWLGNSVAFPCPLNIC